MPDNLCTKRPSGQHFLGGIDSETPKEPKLGAPTVVSILGSESSPGSITKTAWKPLTELHFPGSHLLANATFWKFPFDYFYNYAVLTQIS